MATSFAEMPWRHRPRPPPGRLMAENDENKTEQESQKRLEESRDKGELPRSLELGTFVVFTMFLIYFGLLRLQWFDGFGAIARDLWRFDDHMRLNIDTLGEFLAMPILRAALLVAPLFAMIMIVSPLTTLAQTGFNMAREKIGIDWERLDPIAGFRRIFSLRQVIEGGKSAFKVGLFAWLAWKTLEKRLPQIAQMSDMDTRQQLITMMDAALEVGIRVTVLMAVLAVFDYGYQWWDFHKRLRMTFQEMKDEVKEREGNPLVRQRQRSLAMHRARQRMMEKVKKAKVVVANPTHYAVALSYERSGGTSAPVVCAKGRQYIALQIRRVARENGVPIVENRLLARQLFAQVKIGQVIPSSYYRAVAEILAFVFLLERDPKRARQRQRAGKIVLAPTEESVFEDIDAPESAP
jgi:flagellar biosynthetic protein FlhB